MAKVVVRNEDLVDAPVSSELPGSALVDSTPELEGEALKARSAPEAQRPATPARDARAPARRSSIPPAPAQPEARRTSAVPPARHASSPPEGEPKRGSRPPVPRPAAARALEQDELAAVPRTMTGEANGSHLASAALVDAGDERETLLGVLPTAADERETLLGVPVSAADVPVAPRRSETPPAMAQRGAHALSSYADDSRGLMTGGPYGAREVHSSEWDSPDTLPKPFAAGNEQTASAELKTAHLLRRLRRTIPLYAPLPDSIRKLLETTRAE